MEVLQKSRGDDTACPCPLALRVQVFMVMEYMEHDLRTYLDNLKEPLSLAEIKCVMVQLLAGLEYMHEHWVLHRDLKTTNILINNDGRACICDFGLARCAPCDCVPRSAREPLFSFKRLWCGSHPSVQALRLAGSVVHANRGDALVPVAGATVRRHQVLNRCGCVVPRLHPRRAVD